MSQHSHFEELNWARNVLRKGKCEFFPVHTTKLRGGRGGEDPLILKLGTKKVTPKQAYVALRSPES
jgi:hypothetical protein